MKLSKKGAMLSFAALAIVAGTFIGSGVSQAAPICAYQPLVRYGAKGPCTFRIQQALIVSGHLAHGQADGIFGPKTLAAVKSFQKSKGLTVDGIVGPKTWKALNQIAN